MVQYFHRSEAGVELPTTAPVLKSALKGIARGHVASSGILGDAVRGGGSHPLLGCRGKVGVALFASELFPGCPVG